MSQILGDVKDLRPPVHDALMKALSGLDAAGIQYRLTSGYRSPEEQAKLYQEWQQGVPGIYHPALPGHSQHQAGTAIDLEFTEGDADRGKQILATHGFAFTGGRSDPVHYDFRGAGIGGAGNVRRAAAPNPQPAADTPAPWRMGAPPPPSQTPKGNASEAEAPWRLGLPPQPAVVSSATPPTESSPWRMGVSPQEALASPKDSTTP